MDTIDDHDDERFDNDIASQREIIRRAQRDRQRRRNSNARWSAYIFPSS
jgi:hypothetical protein